MSEEFKLLEKLVNSKLKLNNRHIKELEILSKAPFFIPKAFLQAYQHVILNNNNPMPINECHSLIAFDLGITSMHPGKISFHYPVEASSFPDYDVDFAFPDKVKEYIKEKYGSDNVVGISTYGSYKVKSLLYDLCRVLKDDEGNLLVEPEEARELNKKLPFKIDAQISQDISDDFVEEDNHDNIFTNKDIQNFQQKYPQVFEHFKKLYALPRYSGVHAAGILVLPDKARNILPLKKSAKLDENDEKMIVSEWIEGQGVSDLSSMGAIKIDILGLKTLKILDDCNKFIMSRYSLDENTRSPCLCKMQNIECKTNYKLPFLIRPSTGEKLIDFDNLCLNIPKIFENIANKENQGVFQFEPDGISAFGNRYGPKEFYDLALITALYRPGALDAKLDEYGMPLESDDPKFKSALSAAETFIKRRKGELPVIYPSEKVKHVLEKTNGIVIMQEHLSQMIMAMTNCSFSDAEKVRKFLTKVKPELVRTDQETINKINIFYEKYKKEALANNCTQEELDAVWNLILPFARYGFNVSHAVSYSIISYQTGFCRTFFPLEFLTSLLIHNVDNTSGNDKVIEYIRTAQKLNYNIVSPDINKSDINFTINENNEIVCGLTLINHVGEKSAVQIVQNRNEFGQFTSIEDFLSRKIQWRNVDIRVLEVLTNAGVFDSISPNRALTLAKIQFAKKRKKPEEFTWVELGTDENNKVIKELYVEDFSSKEKESLEREAFGFNIIDYVVKNKDKIGKYKKILTGIAVQKNKHVSAGTINTIKVLPQKNGEKYARIEVANIDGVKESWLCFSKIWNYYKNDVKVFGTYFVLGKKDEKAFLVDSIQPIDNIINIK